MISAKGILRFLVVFSVVFCVLMVPQLRLAEGYKSLFQSMGTWCFYSEEGRREVTFVDSPLASSRPTFSRIEIANRHKLHIDGSGPVRNLDFDVRGLAWQPTALLIALVLATPLPWKRRLVALLWGLLGIQVIVMVFLSLAIWNESSEIGLVTMSPFWKNIASLAQHALIAQFGIAAPFAIWLIVTFRALRRGERES